MATNRTSSKSGARRRARAGGSAATTAPVTPAAADLASLAREAFVFGYPLVLMDLTRLVMTAVPRPTPERYQAPMFQFLHVRHFVDHAFRGVVNPNADALYSSVWLDLKPEPVIFSVPEMGERLYLAPALDGWSNVFASFGTRATGNHPADYALVGPSWSGKLPAGVHEVRAPTSIVWLPIRTFVAGPKDYAAAHRVQNAYRVTPLSRWGAPPRPPADAPVEPGVDPTRSPNEHLFSMGAADYYARLCALMVDNPPGRDDPPLLERLSPLGIHATDRFDFGVLSPEARRALDESVRGAAEYILSHGARAPQGERVNGWRIERRAALHGVDYARRAYVALTGLGSQLPEDAMYPMAAVASDGQPLDGRHSYTLTFAKAHLPPVHAFWSLTMYQVPERTFADNSLSRYSIGDRNELTPNDDGSTTIYVQRESPGPERESNWLPAPPGEFELTLRLYWPSREIVDGRWTPPPVVRVG